jgi:hypothetical protein
MIVITQEELHEEYVPLRIVGGDHNLCVGELGIYFE